jgi:hypothetical protein
MIRPADYVRFTPESGHWLSVLGCPLCASSRDRLSFQAAGKMAKLPGRAAKRDMPSFGKSLAAILPGGREFVKIANTAARQRRLTRHET